MQLYRELAPDYENVHRGQSDASQAMTAQFEASFDTIAQFINAPGRESVAVYRNATEALNAVMYSLLTEFRDGDNVVTTMMEHNSNYVPWHALCREILPTFGIHVECRLIPFDHDTGELDLAQLAAQVDERTKLVCCTGVSNFLGTRPPLDAIRRIATRSGYRQPDGDRGSRLLIDGAQLVPSTLVDVRAMDVDYLVFSFHKMLAPFGVGVLYAKPRLLRESRPFLYGGDMIAEGQVFPDHVAYNALPWKFAAGTPNILGTIASAQALRLLSTSRCTPPATSISDQTGRSLGPMSRSRCRVLPSMAASSPNAHSTILEAFPASPSTGLGRPNVERRLWPSTFPAGTPSTLPTRSTPPASNHEPAATVPPWPTTTSTSIPRRAAE